MIVSPQVSSGWFQRPYPYHLDYYRMRYGGSYAPYFGNLYGPSGYPAYYGPYYGGYGGGYGGGYMNGYGPDMAGGAVMDCPPEGAVVMPEVTAQQLESAKPPAAVGAKPNVVLPAPAPAP
jgi:hypothetical protein